MGIVPENEYMIGCECAGVIKRIASGVTKFSIGDRVACMRSGTYVNRVQCPADRVHVIPDNMSFEDASTIPLVYLTAIYALYHLGNLREGQVRLFAGFPCSRALADPFVAVRSYSLRSWWCWYRRYPACSVQESRREFMAESINDHKF